jgi:hypothetical protein
MEAYYMRRIEGGIHIHASVTSDCIYFPNQQLVLYRESLGTFSNNNYSITTESRILEEMRKVVDGKFERAGKVSYSKPQRLDVGQKEGMALIEDARQEKVLRKAVESGIEKLIAQGKI